MKRSRSKQIEQALQNVQQLASTYEKRIAVETDPTQLSKLQAEYKKTQRRIREFEELLGIRSSISMQMTTQPTVEHQSSPSSEEHQQTGGLSAPRTSTPGTENISPQNMEPDRVQIALERLALPHWFTEDMCRILLSDLIADSSEQKRILEGLLAFGQVEIMPGSNRYRVIERLRADILKSWQEYSKRTELIRLSTLLTDYSIQQVTSTASRQDEWRCEQLYHLAVADPERAMQLMQEWFDESVEKRFDLNQGYCWLLALEERRELLTEMERARTPAAEWTTELARRREYLTARAFWTEEWFRTINYQERDELKRRLEDFFNRSDPDAPWLLILHAQGGYGKTNTIQWLLARYLLPNGFICARFDYDGLSPTERMEVSQQPDKILRWLSENLNAQRSRKIEAFQRQGEQRSDPIGNFTLLLREMYGDKKVVLFVDTLEKLLENDPDPTTALKNLLNVLVRIREGDHPHVGSTPGHTNLRVVLSGRLLPSERYDRELRQMLSPDTAEHGEITAPQPLVNLQVSGFILEEGKMYLSQKRKLDNQIVERIISTLGKITASGLADTITKPAKAQAEIVPLKLAMYVDFLKEDPSLLRDPNIDISAFLAKNDIDITYLVDRILKRIQNPAIRWLLRYGVIFRRLDVEAAQVLMPFLEQARAGHKELDDPDLDPPGIRKALAESFQQGEQAADEVSQLFNQLTRYSWVDRQGDYIKIHPDVREPQLQIVAKQKIFKVLQQAAFEHYKQRIENTSDPQQQADYLREAIFHVLQTGEEGIVQWREQFERYRNGPAVKLWTLVDETFLQTKHPWPNTLLSDKDRFHAYHDLANVLLAEKEQPFLTDQLEVAEEIARKAFDIAPKVPLKASRFSTYLVLARIALARRKLPEALDIATKCAEEANSTDQRAEALVVLGEAQAANSLWEKALDTLRSAYTLIKKAVKHGRLEATLAPVYHRVRLELIEQLLNSPNWRDALPLLKEALRGRPHDPVVLANAARLAFKQARFKEAAQLYQQAIERSDKIQAEKLTVEQQRVQLYQGERIAISPTDMSMVAVIAAAMRADWLAMESLLDIQLATATEARTLEVINILLQYYVEVMGDWRQVQSLLERGAKWVARLPETDPAVARYDVLRQYVDFLNSPPVLKPDVAVQECERRLNQVIALRTPEARVRAKAYLLQVRFFGGLEADQAEEREAIKIYTRCATEALDHAFDLLLQLAPIDQVDIMRTLAALPGWSSALINDVALDPGERSPLLVLAKSLARVDASEQLPFLARLAKSGDLQVQAKLDVLRQQILTSGSDWPLLYTSFARLLAAFGQTEEARRFMREAPIAKEVQTPYMRILIDQDRAFIASWEEARMGIAEAIASLQSISETSSYLLEELELIDAYLSLEKGTTEWQWRITLHDLSSRISSRSDITRLSQDLLVLRAVSSMKLGYFDETNVALKGAVDVALNLGNIYAVNVIRTAQNQLEHGRQSQLEPSPTLEMSLLKVRSTPLTISQTASQGLELICEQINHQTIEVALATSPWQTNHLKTQTQLQGIKRLLPQGASLTTLPDLDYWQKLLNADSNQGRSLEQIGATLLDDLLPLEQESRSVLVHYLQHDRQPLHFITQGTELERLPWSILYDFRTGRWLSEHFLLSYNRPPAEPLALRGVALAVFSAVKHRDRESTVSQIQALYKEAADTKWFYSHELLGQSGPLASETTSAAPFLGSVKMLHLVGDLSEFDPTEGIFLNMGTSTISGSLERLTPDHLARRLRKLNISNCLIVLEPLSTGSSFEDLRVLMLRNSYAMALARLGSWTVLALSPRHTSTTTRFIERLLNEETLTASWLEKIVQEARQQTPLFSFNSLLEGQYDLFYPSLI